MSAKSKTIRVLIVDDHEMLRSGISDFLGTLDDIELVGEASNGSEALERCAETEPHVVLMDLVMPEMGGVEATRRLRQEHEDIRIIALSSFDDSNLIREALDAGAIGYLMKNVSAQQLGDAIRNAHRGLPALSPEAVRTIISKSSEEAGPGFDLTPREREVLRWMVAGLTNPRIAARLVISRSTVKKHVSNILSKLGVSSRTEAVALAFKHGLAER